MFPVRIGTKSRWFLLEVENLFPDRLEVVRTVGSECFCFGLAKNIGVLMVLFRNSREVDLFGDNGGFGLYCGTELEEECFQA